MGPHGPPGSCKSQRLPGAEPGEIKKEDQEGARKPGVSKWWELEIGKSGEKVPGEEEGVNKGEGIKTDQGIGKVCPT